VCLGFQAGLQAFLRDGQALSSGTIGRNTNKHDLKIPMCSGFETVGFALSRSRNIKPVAAALKWSVMFVAHRM
jgi:hypothetical protein